MSDYDGLNQGQIQMFDQIVQFAKNKNEDFLVVSAPAGYGKTFCARRAITALQRTGMRVTVATFTGRASLQLSRDGIEARTIHSILYVPMFDQNEELIGFRPRDFEEVVAEIGDLLVIDEGSMINEDMHNDLAQYGIPIVYLGDYDQLPPIDMNGGTFNPMVDLSDDPISLTESMRFKEDSGIGRIAAALREDEFIPRVGGYDDLAYVSKSKINNVRYHEQNQFDIIICGMNKTRKKMNALVREARGYTSDKAEIGETVMCLRNDVATNVNIYNGELFIVEGEMLSGNGLTTYILRSVDDPNKKPIVTVEDQVWESEKPMRKMSDTNPKTHVFTFGYSLTCHKVQGSSVPNVLYIDENVSFFLDQRRFRYTACSRAVNKLTIAR